MRRCTIVLGLTSMWSLLSSVSASNSCRRSFSSRSNTLAPSRTVSLRSRPPVPSLANPMRFCRRFHWNFPSWKRTCQVNECNSQELCYSRCKLNHACSSLLVSSGIYRHVVVLTSMSRSLKAGSSSVSSLLATYGYATSRNLKPGSRVKQIPSWVSKDLQAQFSESATLEACWRIALGSSEDL